MKNILVTGATGAMGTTFINTLLSAGMEAHTMHALTRSAEKGAVLKAKGIHLHIGNYNEVPALEAALQGIETVLLIASGDQGDRLQEHKNVIDAAVKMGASQIAYTSRSLENRATLANKLMEEHFQTEELIAASGLKYILFQNALYMDTIPVFVGEGVFERGIAMPAGSGKVAFALRAEQAEAMAMVLLRETFENQTYKFTGNHAYSFYEVAHALSEISGKEVKYHALELPAFEEAMQGRGLPNAVIAKIAAFNADIKNGQEANVTGDLEEALGRVPADLVTGLRGLYAM